MSLYSELKRRNVLRAAALYLGAAWALAQGLAQLFPVFGVPEWVVRWLVVAALIAFPFAMAFAWFYEFTPDGLKRESDIDPAESIARHTSKKLDRSIIAVLALAVVLLLTNQFVMHRDSEAGRTSADPPAPTVPVRAKSIAVLPLANDSGDPDQQYFSDGLSEDLITALSQFDGLKVISRNSSFQFRDSKDDARTIGGKLGVVHLLEGSVRRSADVVRVTAQLVNAADGSSVWSQRYDRPYRDLFKLQDEITTAVATALKTKLLVGDGVVMQSDRPPSGNLQAYSEYIEGNFQSERGSEADFRRAIEHYQEAIRIDPGYARAFAALSYTWARFSTALLGGETRKEGYRKSRAAADKSIALQPDIAAGYTARGYLLIFSDFDWNAAGASFERALQLSPSDETARSYIAFLRATLGDPARAAQLARETFTTNPLRAGGYLQLARYLTAPGHLDEAETAIRRAIELQPAAASYHAQLAIIEIVRGNADAALMAAQLEPGAGPWRAVALALALQSGNDRPAADAALKALIDAHGDTAEYQIAEVYALRHEPDKVFEWLDRALASRDPGIALTLFDPFLLPYAHDPRFMDFCRRSGLPAADTRAVSR